MEKSIESSTETNYINAILKEQCQRVGANFEDLDFKSPEWYYKHSWTKEQEDFFEEWLAKFLYNNREARLQIMEIPSRNMKRCKDIASFWVFNYGWKVEYESSSP